MKVVLLIAFVMLSRIALGFSPAGGEDSTRPRKANCDSIQYGVASYYHQKFHGRTTASGETYDRELFTAAHNGLPMNTWVKVTNLVNKRSVLVRINDRLHYRNTRVIDLSFAAAKKLGYLSKGLVRVKVEVLGKSLPENYVNK